MVPNNQIAAAVTEDYPSVTVETFDCGYALRPPRLTRPRSNVLVIFCAMSSGSCGVSYRDALALLLSACSAVERLQLSTLACMRALLEQWARLMPPKSSTDSIDGPLSGLRA